MVDGIWHVLYSTAFSHTTVLCPKICVSLQCIFYVSKMISVFSQYSARMLFSKNCKQSEREVWSCLKMLCIVQVPPYFASQAFPTHSCYDYSAALIGKGVSTSEKIQTVLFGDIRSWNGFVVLSYFLHLLGEMKLDHFNTMAGFFWVFGDRKVSVWSYQN